MIIVAEWLVSACLSAKYFKLRFRITNTLNTYVLAHPKLCRKVSSKPN